MIIKSVDLENFRNYDSLSMEFDSGTNILFGNNAQGKTNLLEALYMSGTSKSYKGVRDRELIKFNQNDAHIKTIIEKQNRDYRIDVHLRRSQSKGIAVNQVPLKKTGEMFGILNLVFFSPEDLNIIKDGPSERRKFIDNELCQLDKIYFYDLKNYYKVLDQRNKLLKDLYNHPDLKETLDVWDKQLVFYGCKVIKRRKEFIDEIAGITNNIHNRLTKNKENLIISYDCNVDFDNFEEKLFLSKDHDIRFSQTSVGPHRDDISIKVENVDMRKYGSQGQQRTCALSLKLSELQLMEKSINDKPVLLLDDVLSELDKSRQFDLLENISGIQTIITCTGLDDFIENRFELDRVFHVINGTVSDYKK
jgi:DNA replication and repair protein RecF